MRELRINQSRQERFAQSVFDPLFAVVEHLQLGGFVRC